MMGGAAAGGGLPGRHYPQEAGGAAAAGAGGRPWRQIRSSHVNSTTRAAGRCKRHPHHALIGVCSICLKERLLALALELEEEEDDVDEELGHLDLNVYPAAAADHHHRHNAGSGPELDYLHGLHAAGLEASSAAAEYIKNARFPSTASLTQRFPATHHTLQQRHHHHQFAAAAAAANPYLHNHNLSLIHRQQLPDKKARAAASHATHRSYKSFTSSPRHMASLQSLDHRHLVSNSPPPMHSNSTAMAAARAQPQMLHWRASQNEVSPISLTGLNHFISSVKGSQYNVEPKSKKKKKKSTSLWSLLQKQNAASPKSEDELSRLPHRKSSVQGSPTCMNGKNTRGPDSSSMREVHESLCRGDASSLLSSPRAVGSQAGANLPSSRTKLGANHSRSSSTQPSRGGHWRSSSCIADDHVFGAIRDECMQVSDVQQGASSPSWISSIFHKKKSRARSKSISTACNSSPDLNAVMAASAFAKYGRFSVDAAASLSSGHDDVIKQEARFRKKYASLFEEATINRSSRNRTRDGGNTSRAEEHGCHQCEEVKARRMKLVNFLAAQMNHEGKEREVYGWNGGEVDRMVPVQVSPQASPKRKAAESSKEDMALIPAMYRASPSQRPVGNVLLHSSGLKLVSAPSPPAGSSAGNVTPISLDHMQPGSATLSPIVTSAAEPGVAMLDSEDEEKLQPHSSRLHNVPRSRSWSKSWNKALSPMLNFKGIKSASLTRKKATIAGDVQLEAQFNADVQQLTAGSTVPRGQAMEEASGADAKRAPQHYSFLSKDYSAFSFYFSPLRRSKRKALVEGVGGSMSSARVNALSDQAAVSGLHVSSRHSVDGSCWPTAPYARHR